MNTIFVPCLSAMDGQGNGLRPPVTICELNSSETVLQNLFLFGSIVSHDMSLLFHHFDSTKFVGVVGLYVSCT